MDRLYAPCLLALTLFAATPAAGQAVSDVDRIEEDWELVIGTPSVVEAGPQLTTTMSPVGDPSQVAFTFNLNYRDDPFRVGGLQLRAWSEKQEVAEDTQEASQCSTEGETISWTQRMSLSGGLLHARVTGRRSTTWSQFGQGGQLTVSMPSSLASLDDYSPAVSLSKSGAGWQSNRVTRLQLKQVRYYRGDQLVGIIETPQTIIGN